MITCCTTSNARLRGGWCLTVFTDPQLARVGLSESQAREQHRHVRVYTLPMSRVACANETAETRGLMKAVVDDDTDLILGATVLGAEGGEVLSVLQMAMLGNVTASQIHDGVFSHPTFRESLNNLFMTAPVTLTPELTPGRTQCASPASRGKKAPLKEPMTTIQALTPRQPVPDLKVHLADGSEWSLKEQTPENFTMLVFYRGLHCPVCARYLRDLDGRISAFEERGVKVMAISSDERERAEQARESWKLTALKLAYGLDLHDARKWGLYVSSGRGKTSIGIEEPERFSEPGVFLVRPDGTLYYASVQSMPFARPNFDDLLSALDFAVQKNYPARGEVTQL